MDSIDDHEELERNFGNDITNLPHLIINQNTAPDLKIEQENRNEPLAKQKNGNIPHLPEIFDFLCSREVLIAILGL